MYDNDEIIQNLVIEVRQRSGNLNPDRKVTVPAAKANSTTNPHHTGTTNSNDSVNQQQYNHHSQSSTKSKDGSNSANTNNNNYNSANSNTGRKISSSRHSYHTQQQAGGSTGAASGTTGKTSTNGSAASGRSSSTHHGGHNEGGKRASVARERSFMRSASHTQGNHQYHHDGGAAQGNNKGVATVQRQRSCVANLYGSAHGRSQSSAAMPAATAYQRPKPAMQLYRPPTLRVSDDQTMPNGIYAYDANDPSFKPGLNINAKEFVSLSSNGNVGINSIGFGGNSIMLSTTNSTSSSGVVSFSGPNSHVPSSVLKHSKSSSQVILRGYSAVTTSSNGTGGTFKTISGGHLINKASKDGRVNGGVAETGLIYSGSSPPLRVHFTDDTITYDPDNKVGMIQRSPTSSNGSGHHLLPLPIKRSKSLGSAADLHYSGVSGGGLLMPSSAGGDHNGAATSNAINAIADMAPFPDDVSAKLKQLVETSSGASARLVMEVVRHLFNKIVQGTRYAEPAARFCIAIIEKESGGGETFLETLLNTCQEYYQERDRFLRVRQASPHSHTKWVAFITFLHEMYTQVKRRQRTVVSSTGPGLLLLTLLAESCVVSLEDQAQGIAAMAQTECLFFILTGVGKDIEVELPPLMSKVMGAARDALFASAKTPAVRKTLLQLIEMNAASWQLQAPAVMYYYPGVSAK